MNESEILSNYYEKVLKELSKQKISYKSLLGLEKKYSSSTIQLIEFYKHLVSLGYTTATQEEINFLMKFYQHKTQTSCIDLSLLEKNITDYKQKKEKEHNKVVEGITMEKNKIKNLLSKESKYRTLMVYKKLKEKFVVSINNLVSDFEQNDKGKSNYVPYNIFTDILDENIILSSDEIQLIFKDIPSNENNNYNYRDFISKIEHFAQSDIDELIRNFNIEHNFYLQNLRKTIKTAHIDIKSKWMSLNAQGSSLDEDKFRYLLKTNSIVIEDAEINYIFSLIRSTKEEIDYYTFETVVNFIDRKNEEKKMKNVLFTELQKKITNDTNGPRLIDLPKLIQSKETEYKNLNIKSVLNEIDEILLQHEYYIVHQLYYTIGKHMKDVDLELVAVAFRNEDKLYTKKVTISIFEKILNSYHVPNSSATLHLLLESLSGKEKEKYSYDEFISNINLNNSLIQIDDLYHKAHLLFNKYILSFKAHINKKKIPYENYYDKFCTKRKKFPITRESFVSMCKLMEFSLSKEEYLFLYNSMKGDHQLNMSKEEFMTVMRMKQISKEDFIRQGKISSVDIVEKEWKRKINTNYDCGIVVKNKECFDLFVELNKEIEEEIPKFGIDSFEHMFDNEHYIITTEKFMEKLKRIGVKSEKYYAIYSLIADDHMELTVNLVKFFSYYQSLFQNKTREHFKFAYTSIKNNEYYYFLTKIEFLELKAICAKITQIIYNKKTNTKEYFTHFDFLNQNKLSIQQLHYIITHDLKIKDKLELFFNFVLYLQEDSNKEFINITTLVTTIDALISKGNNEITKKLVFI